MLGFSSLGGSPIGSSGQATQEVIISPSISTVVVSPSNTSVIGGGSQAFSAIVAGENNPPTTVTWSADAGSISSNGIFTAPPAYASAQTIIVTATSTFDTSKSGTAIITVPAAGVIPTPSQYPIITLYSPMRATGINLYSKLL